MILCVVECSGTLSLIAFFALYLGESIMSPTIFSLALRDAGTKTKLASSLLIMTIVGGAVAPVIMGYIADFSKTYPSFLTLKEGSTSHPCPLSSGAREETDLLGARNRYALRLADHQRSSPYCAGWDRLGNSSLQLIVYSLQIFVVIC